MEVIWLWLQENVHSSIARLQSDGIHPPHRLAFPSRTNIPCFLENNKKTGVVLQSDISSRLSRLSPCTLPLSRPCRSFNSSNIVTQQDVQTLSAPLTLGRWWLIGPTCGSSFQRFATTFGKSAQRWDLNTEPFWSRDPLSKEFMGLHIESIDILFSKGLRQCKSFYLKWKPGFIIYNMYPIIALNLSSEDSLNIATQGLIFIIQIETWNYNVFQKRLDYWMASN